MALCPICGRVYCDHTPAERDQTAKETMRDLTPEERALWGSELDGSPKLIALAKKNAHLKV